MLMVLIIKVIGIKVFLKMLPKQMEENNDL